MEAHDTGNTSVPITLDGILQDPVLVETFRSFLVSMYACENLIFLEEVARLKAPLWMDEKEINSECSRIFNKFFKEGSKFELNISFDIKEKLLENIDKPSRGIFDAAESAIYSVLEMDCVPKFQRAQLKSSGTCSR